MTRNVSISDAKSHLSELVGRLMYAGDQIVIERHGKAVAVMIPIEQYMELEKHRHERRDIKQDGRQKFLAGMDIRE